MLKTTSLILLSALAVSVPALAHDSSGEGGHHMHSRMGFMEMDQNGDKIISQQEFEAHFADKFKAADANHDGKVTKEEFTRFAEAERERRRQEMRDRMFSYADTNGDGVISEAESKANGDKMFKRMDRNGDGKIDQNDRMKKDRHHKRMGPGGGDGMMKPED